MKLTFSCFCWAHLSEALLAPFWGPNLGTILRARVVIGAIVGARGAPEPLKAGGSYERLFQEGPKELGLGSDWGRGGLSGWANGCPTAPSQTLPQYREGKKESRCIH